MNIYFLYGGIGLLVLTIAIGLCMGLIRGLKRSSLHLLFFVASVILAYFITKPITGAVLGIKITIDGTTLSINDQIIKYVQENFDISNFATASEFLTKLPNALVSPVMFIVLTTLSYIVFDIIYLIVARIAFGKKKKDFEVHKPYRAYGSLIGVLEAFLFMFITFAPLTSLTKTYQQICEYSAPQSTETTSLADSNIIYLQETQEVTDDIDNTENKKIDTVGDKITSVLPKAVHEGILAYNNCVIGKIAGAGGIGNALFDGLSNFKLNDEKIEFRKEIVTMTSTYDDFVIVYNTILADDYTTVDFKNFRTHVEKFMDDGLFKTVVADSVRDFVTKYEQITTDLNLELPQIVTDYVQEISSVFSAKNFDAVAYLKNDILKLVDVLDEVVNSNVIKDFKKLSEPKITDFLKLVDNNQFKIKTVLKNLFDMNLIKDGSKTVSKFASEKMADMFEKEEGVEIGINLDLQDKTKRDQMVDQMISAIDRFIKLDDKIVDKNKTEGEEGYKIGLDGILSSEDMIATFSNIADVKGILIEVGSIFDDIRNLDLLNLPATETRPNAVKVFDNILKTMNISLLGDEVAKSVADTTLTTLDNYTDFFTFIAEPIQYAIDLDLTSSTATADDMVDKILVGLDTNELLFNRILLPFYQLKTATFNTKTQPTDADYSLKTLVFDTMVKKLSEIDTTLISLDQIDDNLFDWNYQLALLGKSMKALNQGQIQDGEQTKTYIKYILGGGDTKVVMKQMVKDGKVVEVLSPIFETTIFNGLVDQIFDQIDDSIGTLTGKKPSTPTNNLNGSYSDTTKNKTNRDRTIDTLSKLLEKTVDVDFDQLSDEELGAVVDIIKTDAYNNGATEKGNFNNVFVHIIYYLTGDELVSGYDYTGLNKIENSADIKHYIETKYNEAHESEGKTFEVADYYTTNFTKIMTDLKKTLSFADDLNKVKPTGSLDDDAKALQFANEFFAVLDVLKKGNTDEQYTRDEKLAYIKDLTILTSAPGSTHKLISDEDRDKYSSTIATAIDKKYNDADKEESERDADFANALKALFGV